jgi:hypothetical protein
MHFAHLLLESHLSHRTLGIFTYQALGLSSTPKLQETKLQEATILSEIWKSFSAVQLSSSSED